ncbi:MAG: TRAP transporter small permease subunit [Pseudomonadota bacterium]|nr:TRAP transporter small permease subunit [Pseudomonadota bacterium]
MVEINNPWVRFADKLNNWIGRTISYLLLPITFITSFEVFMRYVVKQPTIWAWDLNIQLSAAVILLGGGYTLMENGHVAVDILVMNMSPKRRALLDLITSPFFFLGFCILLWYGWEIGWASFQAREAMPTIWAPPYYPIKLLIPIGAFLLLIQGVAKFIRDLHTYRTAEEVKAK